MIQLVIVRGQALQAAILVFVAIALGGGGSGAALYNLAVQLVALAIIAWNPGAFVTFFRASPRFVKILVAASLLLPALQSIPMPPEWWQRLPGRDLVSDSFLLLGAKGVWFPMSLNVQRTLLACLSLLPALAVLVLTWNLSDEGKRQLCLLVVVAAAIVALLGAQQLALGNERLIFFDEVLGSGNLQGTFANRNSGGLFFDVALCALVGVGLKQRPSPRWAIGCALLAVLFVVALVLTRSRSSMTLLLVPVALAAWRVWQLELFKALSRRAIAATIVGLALVVLAGGVLAMQNQRIQHSLSRFDSMQDARPYIWQDTRGSIKRFWPIGSGIGSFDDVFQVDETLENLSPGRAARAHNDYLELTLESGVAGLLLLAAWACFIVMRAYRSFRAGGLPQCAAAVFVLLALQSMSDYPLRNQTMLCVAALMLGLLIEGGERRLQATPETKRRKRARHAGPGHAA
jgi:O-antigen ligase